MKHVKVLSVFFLLAVAGCATEQQAPDDNDLMNDDTSGIVDVPDKKPLGGNECPAQCPAGSDGAPGAPGQNGAPGVDGLNGSSCSVEQAGDNATISCQDGTSATLEGGGMGVMGNEGPQGEPGPTGEAGPQGVAGLTGPQGLVGPAGAPGTTGPFTAIYTVYVPVGGTGGVAWCNEGDFALGGGCTGQGVSPLLVSRPNWPGNVAPIPMTPATGWACQYGNSNSTGTFVICGDVP